MNNHPYLLLALLFTSTTPTIAQNEGVPVPRSMAGDKGKYYALNITKKGSIVRGVSKRIGVDSVDYDLVEVDCSRKLMRSLGYSDTSADNIKIRPSPSKWFELVPGSSKSDFAKFVCK